MPTEPPAIDPTDALVWAAEQVGEIRAVRRLTGGMTSTMLALETADQRVVLRLMTDEPWRTHGAGLVTRESEIQEMLAGSGVPAPRSLALDAVGDECGHPAHLMTFLPGAVETERGDAGHLAVLAETLAAVHAVTPTIDVRSYQSWAWEAKFVVPGWAADGGLWEAAFDLLRTEPPAYEPCFIHRDFRANNILWAGGHVSGVVDWVETSIGPAWLDAAHCATNLHIRLGGDVADRFQQAYVQVTGRSPEPYYDVMDVVGFLPPPGVKPFWDDPVKLGRLETRLAAVMALT